VGILKDQGDRTAGTVRSAQTGSRAGQRVRADVSTGAIVNTRTKIAAISLSAVALAGAAGVGISYADDPTTTPSPSASPTAGAPSAQQQKQGERARRPLVKRALHGEVTLGGKKTRVIDFQRGTVEKVSATSITVKSTDAFTRTYVVTKDTRVRHAGEASTIGDIKTGTKVRVVALRDGDASTATVIGEPRR
jgi:hypothetical protein